MMFLYDDKKTIIHTKQGFTKYPLKQQVRILLAKEISIHLSKAVCRMVIGGSSSAHPVKVAS